MKTQLKSHREEMDKMGGMHIPSIIRDMFYHMRVNRVWRFLIITFNKEDSKFVELHVCGRRDATFDDFKNAIPVSEACWAALDIEYKEEAHGAKRYSDKLMFFIYSPHEKLQ